MFYRETELHKTVIFLGALYLALLGLSWPGHLQSIDNELSVATAEAMLLERTLLIDESYQPKIGGRPLVDVKGKTYSRFGIGLPLLYTPAVIANSLASKFVDPKFAKHTIYSLIPALFGVLNSIFLFLIVRELGANQPKAALITFIACVFTLAFRYSLHDHSEGIQSAFFLAALLLILKGRPTLEFPAFCLLAFTVLVKDYNLIIVGLFGLFTLSQCRNRGGSILGCLARMGVPIAAAVALILGLNFYRYGNPFTSGYGEEAAGFGFDFFLRDAWPLLFSFDMGYYTFSPVLLLAATGLLLGYKKRPALCLMILGTFMFLWLLSGFFWAPTGAWSLGPRYIVPSILLMCIGLVFLDFNRRYAKWSLIALLLPAAVLSPLYVLQKTQEYNVIRFNQAVDEDAMPPQLIGLAKTISLKAQGFEQLYPAEAFTTDKQQQDFDLTEFQTFLHVNTWYSHLENRTGLPLRWPLLTVHLIIFAGAFFYVIFLVFRCRFEEPSNTPTKI